MIFTEPSNAPLPLKSRWMLPDGQSRPAFWNGSRFRNVDESVSLTRSGSFDSVIWFPGISLLIVMSFLVAMYRSGAVISDHMTPLEIGLYLGLVCSFFVVVAAFSSGPVHGRKASTTVACRGPVRNYAAEAVYHNSVDLVHFAGVSSYDVAVSPYDAADRLLDLAALNLRQFTKLNTHTYAMRGVFPGSWSGCVNVTSDEGHHMALYVAADVGSYLNSRNDGRYELTTVVSVRLCGDQAIPPVRVRRSSRMSSFLATWLKVDRDHEWRSFNKRFSVETPLRNHPLFTPVLMGVLYDAPFDVEWVFNGDRVLVISSVHVPFSVLYEHTWKLVNAIPEYLYGSQL